MPEPPHTPPPPLPPSSSHQALESRAAKCHERNIHDRSLEDIDKALAGMEAAPDIYQKLDLEPLLCVQAGWVCRKVPPLMLEDGSTDRQRSVVVLWPDPY